MDNLIESVKQYLHETLKATIEVRSWKNQSTLPFFLLNAYRFYEISLLGKYCLLILARERADITPGAIRKHLEQIQKHWNGPIIYVQSMLSSPNRKRLIEQHVPFIIPGNQMYLPHFGIDLREYFRKIHTKKSNAFSPCTQAVVIYSLLGDSNGKLTSSLLAEKLGYTLMTITRAFQELQAAEIGEFFREGRERYWTFSDKQTLWRQAKPFLRSPVKKRTWLKQPPFKILAGLSALSHFSHLAPPSLPIFAIGFHQWKSLKQSNIEEWPSSEGASLELEIWNYNPDIFAKNEIVDPLSLYLSLETRGDERIESALDEMMEKIKW